MYVCIYYFSKVMYVCMYYFSKSFKPHSQREEKLNRARESWVVTVMLWSGHTTTFIHVPSYGGAGAGVGAGTGATHITSSYQICIQYAIQSAITNNLNNTHTPHPFFGSIYLSIKVGDIEQICKCCQNLSLDVSINLSSQIYIFVCMFLVQAPNDSSIWRCAKLLTFSLTNWVKS